MDLSEQLVPTNMLPAKSPTHSPTHEQHLSQHRERKRKNPAPEKVDASAEKYLEVSREEPPDDDMIVPVSSGMVFPVSNGYMPFRDMGGHPDDIIDIDEDEDMEDEDEDEEDELAEADEEEEPEEFELPAPIKQQHRPGPGRPPGVKNALTAKPRKSYYIPTGRPRGRPPRNSGERSVDRSVERRPPGRPRVNPPKDGPKRPRGRPRIHPLKDESEKRPRGRPISNPKYLSLVRTNQILEERISNLMDQVESKDKEIRLLRRKLSETGVDVDSVGYETETSQASSTVTKEEKNRPYFVFLNEDGSIREVTDTSNMMTDSVKKQDDYYVVDPNEEVSN